MTALPATTPQTRPLKARSALPARGRVPGMAMRMALGAVLLLAAAPEAMAQPPQTRVQEFTYDPATAFLTQQVSEPDTPAIALTTDYTYDGFGHQLSATTSGPDIANRTTSATYTADGRFADTMTNALTHSETHVTDARFGTVTSLTGPNTLETTWVYDGFGRKTKETRADGTETRWTYELCAAQCPAGGVYRVTAQNFVTSTGLPSTAKAIEYLDKLNRVFRSETEGFDGTPVYVDTEFNARGQVHRVSKPYFQGTPAIDILWATNSYDVVGRLISVTLPDGGVESTAYNGLTTTLTNALTQTSVRVENALGELVSATDNLSNVTTYTYDSLGNLTETNAGGVVTSMTYDIRGLKLTMDDPDMGDWSYSYNALGQLVSQTDAKAQVTTMTYDLLGRLATRTEAEGTTTWTYDTATKGIGKIAAVSAKDPALTETYAEAMTYDSLGRPSLASVTIDSETYDTSTLYDDAGRADTLTYPSGFTVKSVFTARGHLAEVTDSAGTLEYWRADTVNAEGQVTAETLGNGVTTSRVYDPATSRIDSIATVKPGAPATTIQDLAFDFDFIGNLTARRDLLQDREEAFTYDGLNRLTGTTLTDTATLATLTTATYVYDSLGNITNKTGVGAYLYGSGLPGQPGPHAVVSAGVDTYTYDANGSMLTGAGKTTTWTSFNKPNLIVDSLTSDETGFVYGPSRARITQQIIKGGLSTHVTYIGSHYEKKARFNEDDELVHYIRAGATVAIFTEYRDAMDTVTDSKTRYTHRDHLGSIATLTDELGAVTESLSYDPHGKRRLADWQAGTPADPAETPRGFTGHEHLDAVGLIHMNGRVYDPTLGRFLSADPYVVSPETTQGFNRYAYVNNNPLSYTDPSGFAPGPVGGYGGYDGHDGRTHKDHRDSQGVTGGTRAKIGGSGGRTSGSKRYTIPPKTGILGAINRVDDYLSDLLGVDPALRDWHRDLGGRASWQEIVAAATKAGYSAGTSGEYVGNNTIEVIGNPQLVSLGRFSPQTVETIELKVVYVVNGIISHIGGKLTDSGISPGGGSAGVAASWPSVTFPDGIFGLPEIVGEFDIGFTFSGFGIAEDYALPGIGSNPLGKWGNIARGFGKFTVDITAAHGVPSVRDLNGTSIDFNAHAFAAGLGMGIDYETNAWETTSISFGPGLGFTVDVVETRAYTVRGAFEYMGRLF